MSKIQRKYRYLVIVDPQFDFCNPAGSLFVPGAQDDMVRLGAHIEGNLGLYDDIIVTLDSHQLYHIAHPIFWVDENGKNPTPYTVITVEDVHSGKWRAAQPMHQKHAQNYVESLKANKRYDLTIWPVHCRVGSLGHTVVEPIDRALKAWEATFARVQFVMKGNNWGTENYSVVKADVEDPADETTRLNMGLINALDDPNVEQIDFAGQALNFCVADSMRDVMDFAPSGNIGEKIRLIRNATSNVPGLEAKGEKFLAEFKDKGGKLITI